MNCLRFLFLPWLYDEIFVPSRSDFVFYSPWAKVSMDSLLEASTHISDDVGTQFRDDGSRALWKNSFVGTFRFGLILVWAICEPFMRHFYVLSCWFKTDARQAGVFVLPETGGSGGIESVLMWYDSQPNWKIIWLVVWNHGILWLSICWEFHGISSSQLTNSYFSEG